MNKTNRFEWVELDGFSVLMQDFSNLEGLELMKFLNHSHDLIKDRGEKDIVVVTNVEKVLFDHQIIKHFSKILEINKPYVSASAIYNASNVQKAAIESAAQVTNRNFLMFHDAKAVQSWLESL